MWGSVMVTGISLLEGHKGGMNRNLRYFRPSDWRCLLEAEALAKSCESYAGRAWLGDQTKLSSTTILFTVPTLTLTIFSVKPHITSTVQCSEWRNLVLRVGGSVTMKRGAE